MRWLSTLSASALLRPRQMMLEITSAAWQFITWHSRRQPRRGRRATASS